MFTDGRLPKRLYSKIDVSDIVNIQHAMKASASLNLRVGAAQ